LRVDHVADHLSNGPLAGSVAMLRLRLGNPTQQRGGLPTLALEVRQQVALRHLVHVASVERRVLGGRGTSDRHAGHRVVSSAQGVGRRTAAALTFPARSTAEIFTTSAAAVSPFNMYVRWVPGSSTVRHAPPARVCTTHRRICWLPAGANRIVDSQVPASRTTRARGCAGGVSSSHGNAGTRAGSAYVCARRSATPSALFIKTFALNST